MKPARDGVKRRWFWECPELVGRVALRPDAPRGARHATIEIRISLPNNEQVFDDNSCVRKLSSSFSSSDFSVFDCEDEDENEEDLVPAPPS